jgi:hypothetical protein
MNASPICAPARLNPPDVPALITMLGFNSFIAIVAEIAAGVVPTLSTPNLGHFPFVTTDSRVVLYSP